MRPVVGDRVVLFQKTPGAAGWIAPYKRLRKGELREYHVDWVSRELTGARVRMYDTRGILRSDYYYVNLADLRHTAPKQIDWDSYL